MTLTYPQTTSSAARAVHTIVGAILGFLLGFGAVRLFSIVPASAARFVALGTPLICGLVAYRYGAGIIRALDDLGFLGLGD